MSNKHNANVRKSVLINFQIGLIASLLLTYVVFEVYTSDRTKQIAEKSTVVEPQTIDWDGVYTVDVEPKPKVIAQKRIAAVLDPTDFKVIDDDTAIVDLENELKNSPPVDYAVLDADTLIDVGDPDVDPVEEFSFIKVEDVPVFPGCEKLKTNKEKAACFNEKIRRIVSRKFNADIGSRYGLTGKQRIYTEFDVSTDGAIQNVRVRAPHPKLQKEAERVIGLFPKMTPGKQRKKPVTVKYQLPIMFKIGN